jgi:hypothetical protein
MGLFDSHSAATDTFTAAALKRYGTNSYIIVFNTQEELLDFMDRRVRITDDLNGKRAMKLFKSI